jgi:flagellar motor switch protein FliG
MMDFDDFGGALAEKPLTQAEKAAAVLLAMGKGVAGRLLKYFTQAELQTIIGSAQALRAIPPDELLSLVAEFEDLFTEGAGLMDNAKAIESILEEGLTPDEVDSLLGRRTAFQATRTRSGTASATGIPFSSANSCCANIRRPLPTSCP